MILAFNVFCVRHLHSNIKTAEFRGLALKKGLWNVAKVTIMTEYNFRMAELAQLDPNVVACLSVKPPIYWSR